MADLGYEHKTGEMAQDHKSGFTLVEPGWKKVVIIASEMKDTIAGNGKYLELTDEIQDGTSRTLIDRLNLVNPSEQCQKIGRGALDKIALAVGHKGALTKSEILHGRPFEVKVEIEEKPSLKGEIDPETGKIKMYKNNVIKDYRPVHASSAAPAGAAKSPVGW